MGFNIPSSVQINWETLALHDTVQSDGYVEIFVANESAVPTFFDNIHVTLEESMIVQESHFYPYGMQMQGIGKTPMLENRWAGYNGGGSEKQKDLVGKGYMLETDFRPYDPQLGRFNMIDPLASKWASISTYHFAFNNPIKFQDPLGLEPTEDEAQKTDSDSAGSSSSNTHNNSGGGASGSSGSSDDGVMAIPTEKPRPATTREEGIKGGDGEKGESTKSDKHKKENNSKRASTVFIRITAQKTGKKSSIRILNGNKNDNLRVDTYKMVVTDDAGNPPTEYEVLRDGPEYTDEYKYDIEFDGLQPNLVIKRIIENYAFEPKGNKPLLSEVCFET